MAKQSGLGDNLYVGGYDLSGDIGSLGAIHGGSDTQDVTGIDKSGKERLGLVRDGDMEFLSFFNPSVDRAHDRFENLPLTDQICSYLRGTALGGQCAHLVAKQLNYDATRAENGALTFKINMAANGFGLEWAHQLTAGKRTDGGATNGTGVDFGASSAFGFQAYLQVFAFTGTSATVKVQSSTDNGGGDPYADVAGGAFTVVTGITAERIATAAISIEQWLRVVTTGTFSNLIFAVGVARNLTAVVF